MNNSNSIFAIIFSAILGFSTIAFLDKANNSNHVQQKVYYPQYTTNYTAPYVSSHGSVTADNLQCPIPMENRVFNQTGIQCVWASIETLGRWANESKLMNPPLISRPECQGYSGPHSASIVLSELGVRFEQSYKDREQGIMLIKKAMSEGRGCLWGVPGHAMVLVHYSEEEDKVCWIDNSDQSLKVQTTTISSFQKRWDSWVLVIYADNDIISTKLGKGVRNIPIYDWDNPDRDYPKDYIPIPR